MVYNNIENKEQVHVFSRNSQSATSTTAQEQKKTMKKKPKKKEEKNKKKCESRHLGNVNVAQRKIT